MATLLQIRHFSENPNSFPSSRKVERGCRLGRWAFLLARSGTLTLLPPHSVTSSSSVVLALLAFSCRLAPQTHDEHSGPRRRLHSTVSRVKLKESLPKPIDLLCSLCMCVCWRLSCLATAVCKDPSGRRDGSEIVLVRPPPYPRQVFTMYVRTRLCQCMLVESTWANYLDGAKDYSVRPIKPDIQTLYKTTLIFWQNLLGPT